MDAKQAISLALTLARDKFPHVLFVPVVGGVEVVACDGAAMLRITTRAIVCISPAAGVLLARETVGGMDLGESLVLVQSGTGLDYLCQTDGISATVRAVNRDHFPGLDQINAVTGDAPYYPDAPTEINPEYLQRLFAAAPGLCNCRMAVKSAPDSQAVTFEFSTADVTLMVMPYAPR